MTANLIDQYFVKCKDYEKFDIMTRLFDVQSPELTIIFGRTKRRVDELARGLEMRGYRAEGIHGDLSQQKRMSVLRDFKNNKLDILVATDVAARGLDISGVTHVYNYDIPQDPESYVHRIGRTGRAGKEGKSITLVTPNEMEYLHVIEDLTKKRMTPLRPPTPNEALEGQMAQAIEELAEIAKGMKTNRYRKAVEVLVDEYEAEDLAALLLKMMVKDAEEVPVKITPERPLPSRKVKRAGRGGNGGGRKRFTKDNHNRRGNGKSGEKRYDNKRDGEYRGKKKDNHGKKRYNERGTKRSEKKSYTIRHKD